RELASVKRRRQEREQERMARDEEREMMQREKEGAYYQEWEKQEDMFHIEQARMRSKIRIHDGRAKPIDLLAQYVNPDEDSLEFQMHEPYSVLVVCDCHFLTVRSK
ncbi:CG1676, partial, partial [Paramuricea clavata]